MPRAAPAYRIGILTVAAFGICLGDSLAGEPPRPVDKARAASAGIRKLTGRHLTLYTDVAADPEVDRLPAVFDAAVPRWAEYFEIPVAKTADWHVRGYLIADRRRFDALGLMPAGNDTFINGINLATELWFYDQPTDYYRRHLLLHEGTHVFMVSFLGSCGPGWYMEGTAELLATHRLGEQAAAVSLGIMPRDREEVPMLGRIKLIQDAVEAGRALDLPAVMRVDTTQQLGNEAYAWCWAAAKFLDAHPRYRKTFRQLKNIVREPDFNVRTRRKFADWKTIEREWRAFVATLDHDYDFDRMAIEFRPGTPLGPRPHQTTIAADRGWQSSGLLLQAHHDYEISAAGRFQIHAQTVDGHVEHWPCEPGGVTIEYHAGRPLGILLGAWDTSLDKPFPIGLGASIRPTATGTLYLRVNDSAANLDDNRGTLSVTIEESPAPR